MSRRSGVGASKRSPNRQGEHRPASLDRTSPVVCWPAAAVEAVANAEHAGRDDAVLLRIDPAALRPGLRVERDADKPQAVLVDGPINLDAVYEVDELRRDNDRFMVDDEVVALIVQGGKILAEVLAQARSTMAGFDRPG